MTVRVQNSSVAAKQQAAKVKQAPANGWKAMGHINQMWPKGSDPSYVNGAFNCAASSVAMLVRGWGKKPNLNDAQLITHLARGNTTDKGSTPDDVANMLKRVNIPMAGDALGGPFDSGRVKDHLKKGHMLIAQVGVVDKQTKEVSSHYVVIKKMTADGNFVISDPLKKKSTVVSPKQLARAVNKAPPDGGVMVPVGRPGGDLKPQTPPPVDPAAPQDPWAFQYPMGLGAYRAMQPFQPYPPMMGEDPRTGANHAYRLGYEPGSDYQAQQFRMGDAFQAGNVQRPFESYGAQQGYGAQRQGAQPYAGYGQGPAGYSTRDQFTSAQPPKPSKPATKTRPDKDAFMASDDEFKGVKNTFVPLSGAPASGEKKPTLKVSYQRYGGKAERPDKQMTPKHLSVSGYAMRLLLAKAKGKEGIEEKLQRLELSPFKKDKAVMALIEKIERLQGGIGKKISIDPYS